MVYLVLLGLAVLLFPGFVRALVCLVLLSLPVIAAGLIILALSTV